MANEKTAQQDDDDMSMWVVFEEPPDFPDQYVARRYSGYVDTGEFVCGATLIEVRAKLPAGLMRLERSAHDDPVIRESWI